MSRLTKAEEVFLIVRELSTDHGHFTWKTWYEACKAVYRPSAYQEMMAFKSTVANILRAQVKHKTICRQGSGRYFFEQLEPYRNDPYYRGESWKRATAKRPLYVYASRFNMTPGESRGRTKDKEWARVVWD